MPFYCLYYYKKAQELRPNDSRMLVALGESYEKLDRLEDAMKCFWKVFNSHVSHLNLCFSFSISCNF